MLFADPIIDDQVVSEQKQNNESKSDDVELKENVNENVQKLDEVKTNEMESKNIDSQNVPKSNEVEMNENKDETPILDDQKETIKNVNNNDIKIDDIKQINDSQNAINETKVNDDVKESGSNNASNIDSGKHNAVKPKPKKKVKKAKNVKNEAKNDESDIKDEKDDNVIQKQNKKIRKVKKVVSEMKDNKGKKKRVIVIKKLKIGQILQPMTTDFGRVEKIKTCAGEIAVVICGDEINSIPMICLHGWGFQSWSRDIQWLFQPASKLGYCVYAPDMPGFGRSEGDRHCSRSETNYDKNGPIQILEDLMKHYNICY